MLRNSGLTCSTASAGPEQTKVELPEAITSGLPLTGAAMKATPMAARRSRMEDEVSTEMLEQSITTCGFFAPGWLSRPALPSSRSSTTSPVASMVTMMSQPARSCSARATCAPWARRGSALSGERL